MMYSNTIPSTLILHAVYDEYTNKTGCSVGYIVNDLHCYVCRPGSFSPGGEFRDCIPCDFGSYTDRHGSPFCLSCPPGKTTYKHGSTSADDCEVSWKIYAFLFGLTTVTSLILFIRVVQAWSSEHSIRSHVFEDKLSRYFQSGTLKGVPGVKLGWEKIVLPGKGVYYQREMTAFFSF
ncbi:hypothetical protein V5799_030558 [Amblyomma americanum]|uniref:Tyrosine-protein kinase ephrin type A/B receptor-like domain-containing protein n=1 Tax=Amblyomma americanum TaxID=6943 RepID=A0AAQ4EMZ3_AMBAM